MFLLIIGIMFVLAIMSQVPSETDLEFMTGKAVAEGLDKTGKTGEAIETVEHVNSLNPKSVSEKKAGNVFYNLIQNKPKEFLILAGLIALILFALCVRLKSVRQYGRSFSKYHFSLKLYHSPFPTMT